MAYFDLAGAAAAVAGAAAAGVVDAGA